MTWECVITLSCGDMTYECDIALLCRMSVIYSYGVAMISRLLKIIGLFCRISSLL